MFYYLPYNYIGVPCLISISFFRIHCIYFFFYPMKRKEISGLLLAFDRRFILGELPTN